MISRRPSRTVHIGKVKIGGKSPISVQSMTNTDTRDVPATLKQIRQLEKTGCQIIRVAVPDEESAQCLGNIKSKINIPLVADIHFDYRLALLAIKEGVDALRLNPGNIRDRKKITKVVEAAKKAKIPIRIGVNSGSLEPRYQKYSLPRALVKSAVSYLKTFEKLNFHDTIISLKTPDVTHTVKAYRLMAGECNYPLHLGITAAGLPFNGIIRSSVGLGILLAEGIGDTIRVSLTGDPAEEVKAGREILKSMGLINQGPVLISCPTCGRCKIDVAGIAQKVEKKLSSSRFSTFSFKVAVMGCAVNGPGEAREADIGIAGGKGFGILFRKGKVVRKIPENKLVETILHELENRKTGQN